MSKPTSVPHPDFGTLVPAFLKDKWPSYILQESSVALRGVELRAAHDNALSPLNPKGNKRSPSDRRRLQETYIKKKWHFLEGFRAVLGHVKALPETELKQREQEFASRKTDTSLALKGIALVTDKHYPRLTYDLVGMINYLDPEETADRTKLLQEVADKAKADHNDALLTDVVLAGLWLKVTTPLDEFTERMDTAQYIQFLENKHDSAPETMRNDPLYLTQLNTVKEQVKPLENLTQKRRFIRKLSKIDPVPQQVGAYTRFLNKTQPDQTVTVTAEQEKVHELLKTARETIRELGESRAGTDPTIRTVFEKLEQTVPTLKTKSQQSNAYEEMHLLHPVKKTALDYYTLAYETGRDMTKGAMKGKRFIALRDIAPDDTSLLNCQELVVANASFKDLIEDTVSVKEHYPARGNKGADFADLLKAARPRLLEEKKLKENKSLYQQHKPTLEAQTLGFLWKW